MYIFLNFDSGLKEMSDILGALLSILPELDEEISFRCVQSSLAHRMEAWETASLAWSTFQHLKVCLSYNLYLVSQQASHQSIHKSTEFS